MKTKKGFKNRRHISVMSELTEHCPQHIRQPPFIADDVDARCNDDDDVVHSHRYRASAPVSSVRHHPLIITITLFTLLIVGTNAQYRPSWPSPLLQREIFVLNLEDGYFGCQVNESTDFLQLFELSKLCDGIPQCFQASDEDPQALKCTDRNNCHPKMAKCTNGVCLDNLCYCNDGFSGKGCDLPDENECKYRPCDVFAHCTNTMGSYYCSCFPGYQGDGFNCKDVNECEMPSMLALCGENTECCNLPGHFVCKCKPGFTGNATDSCTDIDECLEPNICGRGAKCYNVPGSFQCQCPEGFEGNPAIECWDYDECKTNPCGSGSVCTNLPGSYECSCPAGFVGDPTPNEGCVDVDECAIGSLCGESAECFNTPGSYFCQCPQGFTGNPKHRCEDVDECPNVCGANTKCLNTLGSYACQCKEGFNGNPYLSAGCFDVNECAQENLCGANSNCINKIGSYECLCNEGFGGNPLRGCKDVDECLNTPCGSNAICMNTIGSYTCECPNKYLARGGSPELGCDRAAVDVSCQFDYDCTENAVCVDSNCRCNVGYQIVGINCIDVDECKTKNFCGHGAICINTDGGFECSCKAGFEKIDNKPQSKCVDINECERIPYPCGDNSVCINGKGHFKCVCKEGFIGNATLGCKSPCDGVECGKFATCHVNGEEAACICDQGFTFDPSNISAGCIDINECGAHHGPSGLCGQGAVCTNILGGHHCHCPPGFTGDPFRYCEDINECDRKYGVYGQCGENSICTNSMGTFACSCPPGMTGNAREKCDDINECSVLFGPNGKCGFSAVCTNTVGSFTCRCPPGSYGDAFTRCFSEKFCTNNKDCQGNSVCESGKCRCPPPFFGDNCKHPCDQLFCGEHAKCELDFAGNPLCVCSEGYIGKSNSLPGCVDIDECSNSPCGKSAVCRNIPGSYECICPHNYKGDPFIKCTIDEKDKVDCSNNLACPSNEECITSDNLNQCVCRRGYLRDNLSGNCIDVNECTELPKSPCGTNAFCTNLDGSYNCQCPAGYTGNSYSVCYPDIIKCSNDKDCPGNTVCTDDPIDGIHCGCKAPYVREGDYCILLSRNCSSTNSCPQNQECILTSSGFGYCICPKGFTLEANGHCRDINECVEMSEFSLCGANSECINLPGTYECFCHAGFSGIGKIGCNRVFESCVNKKCPLNQRCVNNLCQCLPPFILDGDVCKHPCDWIQCGQNAECVLDNQGPKCQCKPGCSGDPNQGCQDINECLSLLPLDPNGPCAPSAICINVVGNFKCECLPGATGDPYQNGCIGSSKCTSNYDCPENTVCESHSGVCLDACSQAVCGQNSYCVATNHTLSCQCKPGYIGNGDDLVKGCVSPCNNMFCGVNAKCIVNSENIAVCHCVNGFSGNPWAGGECRPQYECSNKISCHGSQVCLNGTCVDNCQGKECGLDAKCDLSTSQCKCLPNYVGNPDVLCVPPLPSPPTCSPGCGLNSHCAYSTPNKCVCNSGTSGNPYKSCTVIPRCENIACGTGANCLESATSVECICPVGFHGNPYISCEDVNECLQGNPCGTGASCINVIGSYQCVCPPGSTGNPIYACQPPQQSGNQVIGVGISCSSTFNCPKNSVCFRAICVQPNSCQHDSQCDTNNVCGLVNQDIGHQCIDPCDTTQCGPNAFCITIDHKAKCLCIESHSGNPHDLEQGCSPSAAVRLPTSCDFDEECAYGFACRHIEDSKQCINVCDLIQCGPNANCLPKDRRPECVCQENFEGNAYDLQKGCNAPLCFENSDCKQDEICVLHPQGYRDCESVCKDFQCGINSVCRGNAHNAFCECRPNFLGDPYDQKQGCQPIHLSCIEDNNCADFQSCRRVLTGLKNCTDVCDNIHCGLNAHCIGRAHQAVCECLPGFIGDATRQCLIPSQHLCQRDEECSHDKKCVLTNENIKDCVDICFNHLCGEGAYCVAKNHRPHCECLSGFTRIAGDSNGACAPNICQTNKECRNDQICIITRRGVLDCVNVCESIKCGPNAKCAAIDHTATCKCKDGFFGNPEDLFRGCTPKDRCTSNTDCDTKEVCQLNEYGVKSCVDGCSVSLCGSNAICITNDHFVTCTCQEGYTGRPDDLTLGCHRISHECFSNEMCPSNSICVHGPDDINICQDPCKQFLCGENAVCSSSNHRAQCTCRPGFIGDPFHMCLDPDECKIDQDCPMDSVCQMDSSKTRKCANACLYTKCGRNALCRAVNHKAKCHCDPGFEGDAYDQNKGCNVKVISNLCENDLDCKSTHKCLPTPAGVLDCVDACQTTTCPPNSICRAVGHSAICECQRGFSGDATNAQIGCQQIQRNECEEDSDCINTADLCKPLNDGIKKCFNACQFITCGTGSQCIAHNHQAYCDCIGGYVRDQSEKCVPREDECVADHQCPSLSTCKTNIFGMNRCAEACIDFTCTPNSKCVSLHHKGQCKCEPGFTGDPQSRAGCIPIPIHQCNTDNDCTSSSELCLADQNGIRKCIDGCIHYECGKGAVCVMENRVAECRCPLSGFYVGSPYDHQKGCIKVECITDKDCPQNKACSAQNFCYDPCVNGCGKSAVCIAQDHNAVCKCLPGYTGDPYRSGCTAVQICESNPCHELAICTNTPGSYTCQCPPDFIGYPYIKGENGCSHPNSCPNGNKDCPPYAICVPDSSGLFLCKNACEKIECGPNAVCEIHDHEATCRCLDNFRGEPNSFGCSRIPRLCKSNPDCGDSQECVDGQCRFVCTMDTECAGGEKCVDNFCVKACVVHDSCSPNEACVSKGYCNIGCRDNSECLEHEACIQNRCQNPCTIQSICGLNALCSVSQHNLTCTCPENFEGNPTPIMGCKRRFNYCSIDLKCPGNQVCVNDKCRPQCGSCVEGERCVDGICLQTCSSDSNCPVGEMCSGYICITGCRSDADCSLNQICANTLCTCIPGYQNFPGVGCVDIDECSTNPCHHSAICENVPGSYKCTCPQGEIGDGWTGCLNPGECPRGDIDCPSNAACRKDRNGISKCVNLCAYQSCGPNAICSVQNHQMLCTCPDVGFFTGDAYNQQNGCQRVDCLHDSNCPFDRQCINFVCENACDQSDCGPHGTCIIRNRQATCRCEAGFQNSGLLNCVDIDECHYHPCHTTAICENSPGSYSCKCPNSLVGNAYEQPGCHESDVCYNGDSDCPESSTCILVAGVPKCRDRCNDPTICGMNATCITVQHKARCSCPKDYIGNPLERCEKVECTSSQDCIRDTDICYNNKCIDVCLTPTACGDNAFCVPQKHSYTCKCREGYFGDPIAGCRQRLACDSDENCPSSEFCFMDHFCRSSCTSHRECNLNEKCENGKCFQTCKGDSDCSFDYACVEWSCIPRIENRCNNDNECNDGHACRADYRGFNDCKDACENVICGRNSLCRVGNHSAFCECLPGYFGNPIDERFGCRPIECSQHNDCKANQVCNNHKCVDPCRQSKGICGQNSFCSAEQHSAVCRCLEGFEGDPVVRCERIDHCAKQVCHSTAICSNKLQGYECHCPPEKNIGSPYGEPGCRGPNECPNGNSDCPPTAICEMNFNGLLMCQNPCERRNACGPNAICSILNRQHICTCPDGFAGNPKDTNRGCVRIPSVCQTETNCPAGMICDSGKCRPPCFSEKDCAVNEKCSDNICLLRCSTDQECLSGEICKHQICQVGCRNDNECSYKETCILNNCKNMCDTPTTCGSNALCTMVAHHPVCTCPQGFTGNAKLGCSRVMRMCLSPIDCLESHICIDGRCKLECSVDKHCAIGEKCFSGHCVLLCRQDKDCQNHEICNANRCQTGCRNNNQCAEHLVCTRNQCINPCEGSAACGPNAICSVVNHRITCTCPLYFVGRPTANVGCMRESISCNSNTDCQLAGLFCTNNRCRQVCSASKECAVDEKCVNNRCHIQCTKDRECPTSEICIQNICTVGCRSDSDCSSSETCINNFCMDPCASSTTCGTNAICTVQNHERVCTCKEETYGNPLVECVRNLDACEVGKTNCGPGKRCETYCRAECLHDSECYDNERCIEGMCSTICTYDDICPTGFVCESGLCVSGCRSDSECPTTDACINRKCMNVCQSPTACGNEALCSAINHQPFCSCLPKHTGNPKIECKLMECIVDVDCGLNQICQGYKCQQGCRSDSNCRSDQSCISLNCIDPCLFADVCGENALCHTKSHQPYCSCLPNYEGNPTIRCLLSAQNETFCSSDADCSFDKTCLYNNCIVRSECSGDKDCSVGHICIKAKCFAGCRKNSDCPLDMTCQNQQCQNPCEFRGACGLNAYCQPFNHEAKCSCPLDFTGNPEVECLELPTCRKNDECPVGYVCQSSRCIAVSGCVSDNECRSTEICENGRCSEGCRSSSDCSFKAACLNQLCQNPCSIKTCGANALCYSINHDAICRCPEGYTGDANQGCHIEQEECHFDQDCGFGKMCVSNRCLVGCKTDTNCPFEKTCINRKCLDPCSLELACGINALCKPINHKADCLCPPNHIGDPKVHCLENKQDIHKYECTEDSHCGPGKVCDQQYCVDIVKLCHYDNVCNPGEICDEGKCIVGCRRDSDCTFDRACYNSKCVNPCTVQTPCGLNAQCQPVLHRPQCRCLPHHDGNPYDYCKPIIQQALSQCSSDNNCQLGQICEDNTCIVGCRFDQSCSHELACINKQCLDPCSFPNSCGVNAICTAVGHHPRCSCSPGYTGDPNLLCALSTIPICLNDIECGTSQICENSKCIEACRTDDTCSYTTACINQRCQDPCSIYRACGHNAICRAENHRAVCTCSSETKNDPFTACDRQEIVQTTDCHADDDCLFGFICNFGSCVEGCRRDDHCIPSEVCLNGDCINPCELLNACGLNADCTTNAHKAVCSCHSGFIGDPLVECRPLQEARECLSDSECGHRLICENSKCVIGCRDSHGCSSKESCINRICQNPCSLFGVCGRNAICSPTNHTAACTCPHGFKGNPNILCTEAPPQCLKDSECVLGQICENTQCVFGCRHDNNCPEDRSCIHGSCQNPCLLPGSCGLNALCQPFNHKSRCECIENYRGNPFQHCEPIPDDYCEQDQACPLGKICENNHCIEGCRNDANCRFEESCINKLCQNPCNLFGACGQNALCKPMNHDRICTCVPDYTGDPRVFCERILPPPECTVDSQCPQEHICQKQRCIYGCRSAQNCPTDKTCVREKCLSPCNQSGACGKNAICTSSNHVAICSCPSGFRGEPNIECKEIPPECRSDNDCGLERICLKQKCIVGCRMHNNCPFDKACVNGLCQSPCSVGGMCGVNTICRAERHEAQCSCLPAYTGDPLKQCTKLSVECDEDHDCGNGYVCANHQCKDINECLQDKVPCGPGASCTNLPGWFKCSCPMPLVGDPYGTFGCRSPLPICFVDTDCKPDQKCNPVTQECYEICSKPGVCGKSALCKANNYRAECVCPTGYQGNPHIECTIRDSCVADNDCPNNLKCLGEYCSCSKHLQQVSSFCIAKIINCSTTVPCPANQECIFTHGDLNNGMCTCPRGFSLSVDGSCKDIDECELNQNLCASGATCTNLIGSYKCSCLFGGDPYGEGCVGDYVREGCFNDIDCDFDKTCIENKCQNPCMAENSCGQNALCSVKNHRKECNCKPLFFGDPYSICRKPLECVSDQNCPGNLICLGDSKCGCPVGYERQLDYCLKVSIGCSATRPCRGNQECILTKGNGFCVCPRGFKLTSFGDCQDIDECLDTSNVLCASNATCHNLVGSFECRCFDNYEGDPYREGCKFLPPPLKGCLIDSDCALNKKCDYDSGDCYDPCATRSHLEYKCGQNALCLTENHTPECYCPPGHEGNPYKLCFKKIICGIDYHCPGNLICLDGKTCGCPPNFFRENDYCFVNSVNCTTNNPCPTNEECVYTGNQSGFCVCPHGYEFHPSGECIDLNECLHIQCGSGAVCNNKAGGYECSCPPDTIGDPYVKGCIQIDGCISTADCANDRECDIGSKQCISPCYICGPHSECTAIDHKAICTCPPGRIGDPLDKQVGCYVEPDMPESRTIPPPSEILVMCLADGVQVAVQLDRFDGLIYVKGHSQDPQCRRLVTSGEGDSINFKVLFGHCGLIHTDGEASFILVIQKHPKLITYRARAYHIKCVYNTGEKTITFGFNVSMITTSGTIANTGPPPTCIMSICTIDGKEISSAEIGDDLVLKVDVQPDFIYGGFARSCVAKTMEEDGEFQYEVTDENGCATDPSVFGNWDYDPHQKSLTARFNAFKFPSSNNLRFQCNIRVCFGSCPPVNCDGVDAFGRRRRRRQIEVDEEDFVLTDTFKEGALREEILVQSNAILTFEKREPQPSQNLQDSSLKIEDIEHVCLPKLGLIISMIITTLLALVAVAVAISCWLMAYRRRPKGAGPLPHPPDFPNPLYTTPEPVPEPIPDYYQSARHM